MLKTLYRLLLAAALTATAAGCVYRINIQQGNFLDQAAVEAGQGGYDAQSGPLSARYTDGRGQLQQGAVGLHLLSQEGPLAPRRLTRVVTVYFEGEKVARLDKPTAAEAAAQDASAAKIKNGRTY